MGDETDPLVVEPGRLVTATFAVDGTVSGSAGCNDYSAPYAASESNAIAVGPVVTTLKVCEAGMDQEAAYLQALESAQSYAITEDGWLWVAYGPGSAGNTTVLVFAQGAAPLTGTVWVLEAFGAATEPQAVPAGTTITAVFQPAGADPTTGEVAGNAGCNEYTAAYVTDDDRIIVKNPMATRRLCSQPVMEQEQAYLQALSDAEYYAITGQRLELSYDDGRRVLVFSGLHLPLEDTLWRLAAFDGEPVALELDVTAIFVPGEVAGQGTVSGTGGCNSYTGAYTVDGEQLTVGVLAATAQFCPASSELETVYLAALQAAESYQVLGDRLEIASNQGALIYLADRTPLEGTLWELVSYGPITGPMPVVPGSDATATFEREPGFPSGLVTGNTGCNDYNATYATTLGEIAINPPVVTRRACVTGLDAQEQQFVQGLTAADSYRILSNVLQISYFGGQQALTFVAAGSTLPVLPTPVPPPVQTLPPTAVLDMPSEAQAYQTVFFSGSRSVAGSNPIVTYRWDFGDGRTASGANIQRAYPKPGTYTVTLTVVDSVGLSDSARAQIRILPAPVGPKAAIDGPSQALVGQSVTFTSKSQQGSSPIVSYAWDLTGAPRTAGTQGSSVTTVYNTPGTYKVSLTVTDQNGLRDTATKQIQILPAAPVGPKAAIDGPSQAVAGEQVTFISRSQQGSSPIVGYAWDLGGAPRAAVDDCSRVNS
jgi:heat shock protein HslJ/PKD repeat protein